MRLVNETLYLVVDLSFQELTCHLLGGHHDTQPVKGTAAARIGPKKGTERWKQENPCISYS
jgi:hypothetical protein